MFVVPVGKFLGDAETKREGGKEKEFAHEVTHACLKTDRIKCSFFINNPPTERVVIAQGRVEIAGKGDSGGFRCTGTPPPFGRNRDQPDQGLGFMAVHLHDVAR